MGKRPRPLVQAQRRHLGCRGKTPEKKTQPSLLVTPCDMPGKAFSLTEQDHRIAVNGIIFELLFVSEPGGGQKSWVKVLADNQLDRSSF